MKKRKVLFSSIVFMFCIYVNGQNDMGYRLHFFPYNFYEWKEDVNKDFIVDTQDVLRIYDFMTSPAASQGGEQEDVNGDGIIDTQDVLKIYEYIQTGLSPTFAAPDPAINVITHAMEVLNYYGVLSRTPVMMLGIFAPIDNGLLAYIDPVSMGQSETRIWKFSYNPTGRNLYACIKADVYRAELQENGTWVPTDSLRTIVGSSATDQVYNRLEDILRNCIVPEQIVPDKHYYRTLSGNYIHVDGTEGEGDKMKVSGGFQIDEQHPAKVIKVGQLYNGTAYLVDQMLYPSYHSVSDILAVRPDFSEFYELLQACGVLATNIPTRGWSSVSKNGNLIYVPERAAESVDYLLNTFHYTMYVPTNDAMAEAYAKGLPTPKMFYEAVDMDPEIVGDSAEHLRKIMMDFIKYHIQEQSIFIDAIELGRFATVIVNENGMPYKLEVETAYNDLRVRGVCSPIQWVNKDKMYNQMAREYWLNNSRAENATQIETSSSIVLHAIDHPLLYKYHEDADLTLPENNQFIYVSTEIYVPIEDGEE